jgi:hypothetical protein
MNTGNEKQIEDLEPGKTINYLEGEILSIQYSQWGIYGKIKSANSVYNYKLKKLESSKEVIVGLDLVIINGFCVKNKKEELVVTDGKFGKVNLRLNMSRYFKKQHEDVKVITGTIRAINENNQSILLEVEQFLPISKTRNCILTTIDKENFDMIRKQKNQIINKIGRIEGNEKDAEFIIETIEILPENHFWYKFSNITNNDLKDMSSLTRVISNIIETVDSFYEEFKNILFNIGKDVSKTSLIELKNLLYSKVLEGELKQPYNMLIPENEIQSYFESMIKYCRDLIYSKGEFNDSNDLLVHLKYFYPSYKSTNLNF